jgi:hypothetical protein
MCRTRVNRSRRSFTVGSARDTGVHAKVDKSLVVR